MEGYHYDKFWETLLSFGTTKAALKFESNGFSNCLEDLFTEQWGPLSLVSTTEELLGRKISGSGLESREYGLRVPSRWPPGTFIREFGTNFAEKRQSLGRCSSLADSDHGVLSYVMSNNRLIVKLMDWEVSGSNPWWPIKALPGEIEGNHK
jgi:hypothetical protein